MVATRFWRAEVPGAVGYMTALNDVRDSNINVEL